MKEAGPEDEWFHSRKDQAAASYQAAGGHMQLKGSFIHL